MMIMCCLRVHYNPEASNAILNPIITFALEGLFKCRNVTRKIQITGLSIPSFTFAYTRKHISHKMAIGMNTLPINPMYLRTKPSTRISGNIVAIRITNN